MANALRYGFADIPIGLLASPPGTGWTTVETQQAAAATTLDPLITTGFPSLTEFDIIVGALQPDGSLLNAERQTVTDPTVSPWVVVRGDPSLTHAVGESIYHELSATALLNNPGGRTTTGDLDYLDATGRLARLAAPANGDYVMRWTGAVPSWVAAPVGTYVVGPASAIDNAIARYDGTTGKLIQGYTSGAPTISDTGGLLVVSNSAFGDAASISVERILGVDAVNTATGNVSRSGMRIVNTANPAAPWSGTNSGMTIVCQTDPTNTQNNALHGLLGWSSYTANLGSGDLDDLDGCQINTENYGGGDVDSCRSSWNWLGNSNGIMTTAVVEDIEVYNATGTITTLTMARLTFDNATGTIVTTRGLHIQSLIGGTQTSVTAILIADLSTAGPSGTVQAINYADKFIVDKDGKVTVPAAGLTVGANLVTLGGAFTTSGAFALTLTQTGATNITLPTSGTLAIVGSPLSQFAATTSSQLAGAISDETGSGALVFANTPTLVTPVIGAATGTSLALTTGAGYLLLANGSTSGLQIKDSGGTARTFLFLDGSNIAVFDNSGSGGQWRWQTNAITRLSMANSGDLTLGSVNGGCSFTVNKLALVTTSTDGVVIDNITAATSGVPVQISPRTRWSGRGWDTDDAVSRTVSFFAEVLPINGNTVTGSWKLGYVDPVSAAITYPFVVGGYDGNGNIALTRSTTSRQALFQYYTGSTQKWDFGLDNNSTDNFIIYNRTTSAYMLTILAANDNFGLGVTTPTATIHLRAGTATASSSPLKFNSGTNLTTAEAGAMEYNGTNLFFTRAGTVRENVLVAIDNVAAPSTSVGVGIVNYYGASATNFLGDPTRWMSINVLGTTYKFPLYAV